MGASLENLNFGALPYRPNEEMWIVGDNDASGKPPAGRELSPWNMGLSAIYKAWIS